MKSSLKIGSAKRKPEKPAPRPHVPGKVCPNCGEKREQPDPGDHGTYPGWGTWADSPHENPFDCIRFLKKELDFVRDDLKSVEKELSNVEAPRGGWTDEDEARYQAEWLSRRIPAETS